MAKLNDDDNLIIKGNNLVALHSLKKRFAGKVKLIYIDPPYNTGKDSFNYNDHFNHSSWLTFMKNRLEVAKELLSRDGVIFISLDDNEAHYAKVLVDDIFGRENFIADIAHKSRASVSNDKIISSSHNHILFYAKNERIVFKLKEIEFKQLSLAEQKQILSGIVDNNNLYVNLSDIDDVTYKISENEKKLNKGFYSK